MKLNLSFSIKPECKIFKRNSDDTNGYSTSIDLEFTFDQAQKFLSRFEDQKIELDNYVIMFKYNDIHSKVTGIVLYNDEYVYIIENPNTFILEVYEGYTQLLIHNKLSSILEIDTEAITDLLND